MAFLDRDGKQLYFEHYPGRGPTVMLVHGWGTGSRIWDVVTAALCDAGYGVVVFDQRGCAASDKDFGEVTISASASDVCALANALDLSKLVLCGWSIGGAISAAALDELGERCVGLISVCGAMPRFTAADDFPGMPPGTAAGLVKQLRAGRATFLAGLAASSVVREVDDADIEKMRWLMSQSSPAAEGALLDLDTLDLRQALSSTDVPVLFVSGGKDTIVPADIQHAASRLVRRGELDDFADCGHTPFIEDPERFCAALLSFVEQF